MNLWIYLFWTVIVLILKLIVWNVFFLKIIKLFWILIFLSDLLFCWFSDQLVKILLKFQEKLLSFIFLDVFLCESCSLWRFSLIRLCNVVSHDLIGGVSEDLTMLLPLKVDCVNSDVDIVFHFQILVEEWIFIVFEWSDLGTFAQSVPVIVNKC